MCMAYHARYDTDLLHIECKTPKLEPRRVSSQILYSIELMTLNISE